MLPAMAATVVSAVLVCAGALVVGQGVLRVCGARSWSWLSPAVGVAVLMLLAIPAAHLPGRSVTAAVLIAIAVVASAVALVREPALRPPLGGVLAGLPAGLLGLVPFLANGHAGTLGVSFNNDMASHLIWAEAYGSAAIERVNGIAEGYPMGPHALVAVLDRGAGVAPDAAFAGLTLAVPVLLAWTALAALRDARWPAQTLVATVVGMPFLVAGYYAQGSFKELLQALFVLAFAVSLQRLDDVPGRWRWAPQALLAAGILSAYSTLGLAWPLATLGLWAAGSAALRLLGGESPRALIASLRSAVVPLGLGLLVLVAVLLPQIGWVLRFVTANVGTNGTGIESDSLGNLAGRLPFWEAFGTWDNPDYRLPPLDPFTTGIWVGLVVGLVVLGAVWWLRRGELAVVAGAVAGVAVWWFSDRTQSPYVAAKALVILTPLLMLIAARPLVEPLAGFVLRRPAWQWIGPAAVALVLAGTVVGSSWGALRTAKVGPRDHIEELRGLRAEMDGERAFFLGNDDFVRWGLAGIPVGGAVIGIQQTDFRPEKPWTYGEPTDFDTVPAATLDEFDWIVSPRDAAGSSPPKGLKLVRTTPSFQLWKRTGPIGRRAILREGANPAAKLDCSSPRGRRLLSRGGWAAVRRPTVVTEVGTVPAGGQHDVAIPLADGDWTLQMEYDSQHPVDVTAGGLRRTMPANLDRPGTRWHVGEVEVADGEGLDVRLKVHEALLTPPGRVAYVTRIFATPAPHSEVVPVREACGKLVDWIEPRRG